MTPSTFSWDLFAKAPIVGIVRGLSRADISAILPLYRDAGLTTIEITMNTPDAEALIRYALDHRTGPGGEPRYAGAGPDGGLNIGAGTVCTMADLEKALAAGAQFIVAPIVSRPVIEACVQRGIPIFPGAFTPTEIYEAWSMGAAMVKVFPATSLGPGYVRDVKAPLNQIKLLPTGGVTLANLADFMRAGADGVGIGSQLFDRALIQARDWTGLTAHFREFVKQLSVRAANQPNVP